MPKVKFKKTANSQRIANLIKMMAKSSFSEVDLEQVKTMVMDRGATLQDFNQAVAALENDADFEVTPDRP